MTKRKKHLWHDRTGPMPEDEVKAIALSIVQGGEWHFVQPANMRDQLLFLSFLNLSEYRISDIKQVGTILGDARQIAPRSVNGLPIYMGGRLIHKDDWRVIAAKVNAIREAIEIA